MLFPALIGDTGPRGPKLTGARILLRQPTSRDWRAWSALRHASRQFLMPWEPAWPHDALTRAAYRRRLRQQAAEWRQGLGVTLFIFDLRNERLLGGISVTNLRRGVAQTASLGYWVGERQARQGLMTEALLLTLDYLFDGLGLHRIEAACLPHNVASRRLLEKIGFQEEGRGRDYLRIAGQWQDHVLYGLLADDPRGVGSSSWTREPADRAVALDAAAK